MKKIVLVLHDPATEETHIKFGCYLARELNQRLILLQLAGNAELQEIRQALLKKVQARARRQGIDAKTSYAAQFPFDEIGRSENTELVILNGTDAAFDTIDEPVLVRLKAILNKTDVPVLVTRNTESELRRPLFAFSGSDKSRQMLRTGLLLLGRVIKRGLVLAVGKDSSELREALDEASRIGGDFQLNLETRIVEGDVATSILSEAAANDCDLIVCGAYIRNRLQRAISSSITEELLDRCPLPLLTGSP